MIKLTKPVVIYDVETTSLDVNEAEVIQFAGLKVFPDGSTESLEILCKPSKPIPPEITEITGISDKDVEGYVGFESYLEMVQEVFDGADVSGFNIVNYDNRILDRYMKAAGVENFFDGRVIYDASNVYRSHARRRLEDALEYYTGEKPEVSHEAMWDVKTTATVIEKQLERENRSFEEVAKDNLPKSSIDKYIAYNEQKQPLINFGKHKGKLVSSVDKGYKKWMLEGDFPERVKEIIRANQ